MRFRPYLAVGGKQSVNASGETGFEEVKVFFGGKFRDGLVRPRILDVGAGNCKNGLQLEAMGFRVEFLDLDPQNSRVIEGDMHELPFDSAAFDFVLCHHAFEHSVAPLIVLCEMYRVLRPGGRAVIVVPDWKNESWYNEESHVGLIHDRLFRFLAVRVGFTVESIKQLKDDSVMWVLQKP